MVVAALGELLRCLERGQPLPWLLAYAPDGDADAAVRRAWDAAPAWALRSVAHLVEHPALTYRTSRRLLFSRPAAFCAEHVSKGSGDCPACAQSIRRAMACPTFRELAGE